MYLIGDMEVTWLTASGLRISFVMFLRAFWILNILGRDRAVQ